MSDCLPRAVLGIEIILANSAQGKGRIERSFDTFQDRLVPEPRLKGIKKLSTANRNLQNVFISSFWQTKIMVRPQECTSEFTPVPKNINLNATFVMKKYRKIHNDHTFSYGNKFYLIESPLSDSLAKQKIAIRCNHEVGFAAHFAGRELTVSEVKEPTKHSMVDMEIQKKTLCA